MMMIILYRHYHGCACTPMIFLQQYYANHPLVHGSLNSAFSSICKVIGLTWGLGKFEPYHYMPPSGHLWNMHRIDEKFFGCTPRIYLESSYKLMIALKMHLNLLQGGPKKLGHYVWRPTFSAHIFKTNQPIFFYDFWHTSKPFYSEHILLIQNSSDLSNKVAPPIES